jgi:hypothetical protein
MSACHYGWREKGAGITMPEIRHFAVAGNGDGRLVIAAIAGPGPDDQQFTPDVWLAQEVSDDIGNPWPVA